MVPATSCLRFVRFSCLLLLTLFCSSCKKDSKAVTAFYYWKSNFQLSKAQKTLLHESTSHRIYLRFFDIKWDARTNKPYPEAIVNFKENIAGQKITPVIFITNQTFEQLNPADVDSLAIKSHALISQLALAQHVVYTAIQIDCDWTLRTKAHYFNFLRKLKAISQLPLEATIRLHQVKYQFKTGVPPVDRGVLMFYNMGKLSPDPNAPNSIYNAIDAGKYLGTLRSYLLPLDIALPVFSWSLQIRSGKIIQVYGKIGRAALSNPENFKPLVQKDVYEAVNSFFTGGIYVKAGDLFKLEETDTKLLAQAAEQLSAHLNKEEKRTIIYYELGNLDLSTFKAADFNTISAYF